MRFNTLQRWTLMIGMGLLVAWTIHHARLYEPWVQFAAITSLIVVWLLIFSD